jgi:hypothetical protein
MLKGARKNNNKTIYHGLLGYQIHLRRLFYHSQSSNLERRDGNGNDLRIAVRDADSGVLDAGLVGSSLGIAVEL